QPSFAAWCRTPDSRPMGPLLGRRATPGDVERYDADWPVRSIEVPMSPSRHSRPYRLRGLVAACLACLALAACQPEAPDAGTTADPVATGAAETHEPTYAEAHTGDYATVQLTADLS